MSVCPINRYCRHISPTYDVDIVYCICFYPEIPLQTIADCLQYLILKYKFVNEYKTCCTIDRITYKLLYFVTIYDTFNFYYDKKCITFNRIEDLCDYIDENHPDLIRCHVSTKIAKVVEFPLEEEIPDAPLLKDIL